MARISEALKTFTRGGLKSVLYSDEFSLRDRLFALAGVVGSFAVLGVAVITTLAEQGELLSIALFAAYFLYVACIFLAFKTGKTNFFGSIVVIVVAFIAFPMGYFLGGGANSGTSTWFVVILLFIAAVFPNRLFWVYSIIATVEFAFMSFYSAIHPEIVTQLNDPILVNIDTFFAATVVGLLVAVLVRYQTGIFERENKRANDQKEEIQALSDAQSRFFSSMSHEIRTPLNTIIGLNEMTLRDQQITEEIAENATNIQNASRMLLSLINDVLDLSKIESGRMELAEAQYETSRMLSDVVNLLWGRAKEKGLRFEVNVGEDVPSMLYGDEMRLKQVIINILTNAIKYTEEGTVTLVVDGEKRGPNEFLLRVSVDDTGIGIRKEALPYLFDSFKRIDTARNRNVEGTGLGLAISKQLIDLMGGTITVDSIYTKGSHFQIEVTQRIVDSSPMQYSSLTQRTATGAHDAVFEAPEAHVLIVDDNDMNRMVARKLLRATRAQTDVAASGRECLEKTAVTHYDVIFMDHEMPEMDGIETLRAVREQEGGLCRDTPVVALTANAGSDMNAFYLKHGFQAYLAKPIHGSLLEATLVQFLSADLVERSVEMEEGEVYNIAVPARRKFGCAITVDSPCGLPEAMLVENNIVRMPFYIVTDEGRFRDVEEINSNNLFNYFETGGRAYATPASVEEYESFFGDILSHAESVIHISASSKVNEAYSTACSAAASFDSVHVVDSRLMSSSMGLVALRAVELAKEEREIEEIMAELRQYSERIVGSFLIPAIDSPIIESNMSLPLRIMVRAFSWEPVMRFRHGRLGLSGFQGGYISSATEKYIKNAMAAANRKADKKLLFVTYAGCTIEEQQEIIELIEKYSSFETIIMEPASATVAASTWMHAFGIAYVKKQ